MEDIERHGGLGGKTFFPSSEHSTDMKTVMTTQWQSLTIFFIKYFFQGEVEGVVIELAHVDVRHPQQGRLKFLL